MDVRDVAYVVESERPIREVVGRIWKEATAAGWTVMGDYDLTELLTEGAADDHVMSIDLCRSDLAQPLVAEDVLTSLCMPCNVVVYSQDGTTRAAVVQASVIFPRLFEAAARAVGDLPAQIDGEIQRILQAAV